MKRVKTKRKIRKPKIMEVDEATFFCILKPLFFDKHDP